VGRGAVEHPREEELTGVTDGQGDDRQTKPPAGETWPWTGMWARGSSPGCAAPRTGASVTALTSTASNTDDVSRVCIASPSPQVLAM
jgi:hypothetical protein